MRPRRVELRAGRLYPPGLAVPELPWVPPGVDRGHWAATIERVASLARRARHDRGALRRETAQLALRARDDELGALLTLAAKPLPLDAEPTGDGLPAGWPEEWPTVETIDLHRVTPPSYGRPSESPAATVKRVARERAEAGMKAAAELKTKQRAAGKAALAALVAAVPPPPLMPRPRRRRRALVASAYTGGVGRVRVQLREGATPLITDRGGRVIHGVEIAPDFSFRHATPALVAAAPPTARGMERASAIARMVNEGIEGMVRMFKNEDEATTAGDVARLASAVEKLADRPQPPVHVTVKAPPQNGDLGKLAAAVEKLAARPPEPVEVTVQAPEPTRTPPRAVRVVYDADGTKWFVPEDDPTQS